MHHQHEHLSLRLHRALHSSMGLFEWSVWLHTFARALISVFIPVLLLDIGFGINDVLLFFLLLTIIDLPLNFLARRLISKIGARWTIIVGSFALLGYFLSLSQLEVGAWFVLLMVAAFAALYDALYWVAHHFFFMQCSSHKKNISRDTSWLFIIQQFAEMLAPLIGAGILLWIGDDSLIYVSTVIVALSLLPLFRIRGVLDRPILPLESWRVFWGDWSKARDLIRVSLYGVHMSAEYILYPLFLFTFFDNIQSVAAVAVIAAIATMVFTLFAGRIKRQHRRITIMIGAVLSLSIWILRSYWDNNIFLYVSVFVVGFCAVMMSVPLLSTLFEKGERSDTLSTAMWRNIASMTGQAIVYAVLYFSNNFSNRSFIIVAISLFLLLIISRGSPRSHSLAATT